MRTHVPDPIIADVYQLEGDRGWKRWEASSVYYKPAGAVEMIVHKKRIVLQGIWRVEYRDDQ